MSITSFVLLAYLPVIFGGFIWDDDQYLLNNGALRDVSGLIRIWTKETAPLINSCSIE